MPSAFVPFLKSGGKSAASRAASVTDSAAMSGAFAALVPKDVATPPGCAHSANAAVQPIVTLKKDGDRVTHIHIQCACGQVVELECAY